MAASVSIKKKRFGVKNILDGVFLSNHNILSDVW